MAAAKKATSKKAPAKQAIAKKTTGEPVLLSGGNPQIPKGEGDAPVQAYISAMPGWKQDVGRQLDSLIGIEVAVVALADVADRRANLRVVRDAKICRRGG